MAIVILQSERPPRFGSLWTMDLILLHHLQALHRPVHLQDESHTAATDLMGCSRFTEFGNSYFAGFWCGISKGSCEACNGLWCAPTFRPTMDLVSTSSPTAASPSARPSLRVTTSPTTSSVNNSTQAPVTVPAPSDYCNWQGHNGVAEGGDWCNTNIDRCTNGYGGTFI
jgi:hypothetical protein